MRDGRERWEVGREEWWRITEGIEKIEEKKVDSRERGGKVRGKFEIEREGRDVCKRGGGNGEGRRDGANNERMSYGGDLVVSE